MSQRSLLLRVGTTALVVAAIEAGEEPSRTCKLIDPVSALRTIASDPTCKVTVALTGARRASALDIQRVYLSCVERAETRGVLPEWAGAVIDEWRGVLADLDQAPDGVATSLDWAIRYSIYRERARRRGVDWQMLQWKDEACVRRRVEKQLPEELRFACEDPVEMKWTATAKEVHPALRHRLADFNALRAEFYETDVRFGQLGDGIFSRLDEAGVLRHRVRGVGPVSEAFDKGPAGTRATLRSHWIRKLAGHHGYRCTWDSIVNTGDGSYLDMPDPFDTDIKREFAPSPRRSQHTAEEEQQDLFSDLSEWEPSPRRWPRSCFGPIR